MNKVLFAFVLMLCVGPLPRTHAQKYVAGLAVERDFGAFARTFLDTHCVDCHSETDPEGALSLHDLGPVDEINAAIWKSVWAQVSLGEMPPADAADLAVVDRLQFSDWVVGELGRVMRDRGGFRAHLDPNKGNFVDHDVLFGPLPDGLELIPASSPARIWRVTPQEHVTRLNELINREPKFDPKYPGLRAHGDAVPTNHGGELKLYFGTDRIIEWVGGTVAYATAVKSVPAILSSARKHGLENYPDFYTVNSAEATQILGAAEDIIKYMAYGPRSLVGMPEQITDDPKTYDRVKPPGDLRGLPTAITYSTKIVRPITPIYDLMNEDGAPDDRMRAAVDYLFEALTFRPPSSSESSQYLAIVRQSIDKLGKEDGAVLGLSSIFLDRDALFRPELVERGKPDRHGRVMLQDWELGLAVNHALRYIPPDAELRTAIVEGRMRTRADVQREVKRMLADESVRKPRILRFFRDYFDYDLGGYICKDNQALVDAGVDTRFAKYHYRAMFDATASTDRLVELILQEDKDVLKQLLTTDKVVAYPTDSIYFGRRRTKEETETLEAKAKKAAAERVKTEEAKLSALVQEVADLKTRLEANPDKKGLQRNLERKQEELAEQKKAIAVSRRKSGDVPLVEEVKFSGPEIYARVSRRSFGRHASYSNGSMKPERVLATVPDGQRLGILTHPSWLVSQSDAMDNHAIHRGRWIRERLLGGGIPDVPITVDAMLPDEPHSTLRERMRVTREDYCWSCHQKMDPLGLSFEMYNHAGIFRTTELDKPVDTTGEIIDSGDPDLDGPVANAIELVQRLAESERVEQVFVRHAFRFWMGRNETPNDGPILREAHRAYRDNGGSMKALIASLLTSDAFLYRTRNDAMNVASR